MSNTGKQEYRSEYEHVKDFPSEFKEGDTIIRVSRRTGTQYYSRQVLRVLKDNKFTPHLQFREDPNTRRLGRVKVARITAMLVEQMTRAEDYVENELQLLSDHEGDRQRDKEHRDMHRGKPKQPMGLKQLAKMDAAKREAAKTEGT